MKISARKIIGIPSILLLLGWFVYSWAAVPFAPVFYKYPTFWAVGRLISILLGSVALLGLVLIGGSKLWDWLEKNPTYEVKLPKKNKIPKAKAIKND